MSNFFRPDIDESLLAAILGNSTLSVISVIYPNQAVSLRRQGGVWRVEKTILAYGAPFSGTLADLDAIGTSAEIVALNRDTLTPAAYAAVAARPTVRMIVITYPTRVLVLTREADGKFTVARRLVAGFTGTLPDLDALP